LGLSKKNTMKKLLQSLFLGVVVLGMSLTTNAQMESGNICPDFTVTDLDGETHNLYSYLDQGYTVVLDLYAVWCGPCWNYHQEHILEDLHTAYGPDGTNEVIVMGVESDASTAMADITGGGDSIGDWTDGVSYIMANDDNIADLLELAYYPTIYTICPNRVITETSQISTEAHYEFTQTCGAASAGSDGLALFYRGTTETCSDADLVLEVGNVGGADLVNPVVDWSTSDGQTGTYTYNGTLGAYEQAEMNLGQASVSENIDVTFVISGDESTDNNTSMAMVQKSPETTTHIKIDLVFDCWPEEVGWELRDDSGALIDSRAEGTYADMTEASEDVFTPSTGCFFLTVSDGYGDGMYGSIYPSCDINGTINAYDIDGDGTTVLFYDGLYAYSELSAGLDAVSVVSIEEASNLETSFSVFPNPTNGNALINLTLAEAGRTTLAVTDMLGKVIFNNDLGVQPAGSNVMNLDLNGEKAGLYIITLTSNNQVLTEKITLTK